MEKITYEVLGYVSQQDYDDYNFETIDEFVPTKEEAIEIGNDALDYYKIVKVQSNDREEISILK